MKTLFLTALLISSTTFAQTNNSSHGKINEQDDSSLPQTETFRNSNPTPSIQVMPVMWFDEHPVNHNMHITSTEQNYYTINGGNSGSGQVGMFDLTGTLVQTFPIAIDGRGISHNKLDGFLYVSTFIGDIVRIDDLTTGAFTTVFPAIMQNAQASFAISSDGTKFYDFYQGTLLIRDFITGAVTGTLTNLSYGPGNYGGEACVAVNNAWIFTWDATIKTVYIYDHTGLFQQTLVLDSGDNGHSLSIAGNLLYVSRDGNYGVGTWYGYDLNNIGLSVSEPVALGETFFPNPSNGRITFSGNPSSVEIYSIEGKKVESFFFENQTMPVIDLSAIPKGIYLSRIYYGTESAMTKIIVE